MGFLRPRWTISLCLRPHIPHLCLYSHRPSPWPCYSHPSSPHHILARPRSLSPCIGQPWSPRIKANGVRNDPPPWQCGSSRHCGIEWEGSYGISVLFILFKLFISILTINIDLGLPTCHLRVCNISVVKLAWTCMAKSNLSIFYENKPISYFLKPICF